MKISILEDLIFKININLESISRVWKEIQKMKSNDTKLILLYDRFLKDVLNDEESGENIRKYKEYETFNLFDNVLGEYVKYIQDGSGYIIASGHQDTLGKVLSANASLAKTFGYKLQEVLKMKINDFMPALFQEEHDERILSLTHDKIGIKKQGVREFKRAQGFGVNKCGYIFPVNLTMSILKSTQESFNFISLIRNPPSDVFKTNPVFFITDPHFYIRYVSSQAISIFGINNNNFLVKGSHNNSYNNHTYLNLTVLIKDIQHLKDSPEILKEYKHSSTATKKRIRIEEIENMKSFLRQSSSRNKAIKLEENSILMEKLMGNLIDDLSPNGEKHFKDYFIVINDITINNKLLGYSIQLDPIKEEKRLLDYKYEIIYDENILHYDVFKGEFYDPTLEDLSKANENSSNTSIKKKTKRKKKKKGKNIRDLEHITANTLSAFLSELGIVDYSQGVISKVINIGTRLFRTEEKVTMKIEDTMKLLEEYAKNSKVKEIDLGEEDKSERDELLEKSTEDLLNFRGIEGFQQIIDKVKRNKVPKEINIFKLASIIIAIIKLILMILFYIYEKNNFDNLLTINNIQNLTELHKYKTIDSVIKAEQFINHINGFINNSTELNIYNLSLINNINDLLNVTNILRKTKDIYNSQFKFLDNRTFILLNQASIEQKVEMNLIEIFMQLLNKMFSFTLYGKPLSEAYDDYVIFFKNSMNVYLIGISEVLNGLNDTFIQKINDIQFYYNIILLVALSLIIFLFINSYYTFKISSLKQSTINLFFHIPPIVCWKYYTKCESFLKFIINDANDENDENNKEDQNKSMISQQQEEENKQLLVNSNRTFKDKKSESKVIMIAGVILINLLYFLIDYSYYGINYLAFYSYCDNLKSLETFRLNLNSLSLELSIYLINQRQVYNSTGLGIFEKDNIKVQNYLFNRITSLFDVNKVDTLNTSKIFSSTIEQQSLDLLINGYCSSNYTSSGNYNFTSICNQIPSDYQGLNKLTRLYFETLNNFYISYKDKQMLGLDIIKNKDFITISKININI